MVSSENRPIDELDHSYGPGKWISNKELEELAIEKYKKNGKGITINDLIKRFSVHKKKLNVDLRMQLKEKKTNKEFIFYIR